MISFIENAPDIANKQLIEEYVSIYLNEVRQILPEFPNDIRIWLDNSSMIFDVGEGGAAYAPDIMNISFDPNFEDKDLQIKSLRGTIFHEAYHMVQGFTTESPKANSVSALDPAIYEGCATIFERQYAGVKVPWGEYALHNAETLKKWRKIIEEVSFEKYKHEEGLWEKLAFYDEESGERWRLYKVGTWLVDEALKKSELDILKLRDKSAQDIIAMV